MRHAPFLSAHRSLQCHRKKWIRFLPAHWKIIAFSVDLRIHILLAEVCFSLLFVGHLPSKSKPMTLASQQVFFAAWHIGKAQCTLSSARQGTSGPRQQKGFILTAASARKGRNINSLIFDGWVLLFQKKINSSTAQKNIKPNPAPLRTQPDL